MLCSSCKALDACPLCFTLAYALEIGVEADCDVEVVGESGVFVDFFMAWDLCNLKMVAQHRIRPFNGKNFCETCENVHLML